MTTPHAPKALLLSLAVALALSGCNREAPKADAGLAAPAPATPAASGPTLDESKLPTPTTFAVVGNPDTDPSPWLKVVLPTRPNDSTGWVRADSVTRGQVLEMVQMFRAKVIDVSTDALVIETTGDSGKIQALLRVLEPYGIKEIAQSGVLAIGRGSKSITERVFKN